MGADGGSNVWVLPHRGDAPVTCRAGVYQPDFCARTSAGVHCLIEVRMNKDLDSPTVQAKKKAATGWVQTVAGAGDHGQWIYLLASESAVVSSKTLDQLTRQSL